MFNVRTGEPTKAYAGSSKGSAESIAARSERDGYWKLAASRIRGTYRGTSITQSAGTAFDNAPPPRQNLLPTSSFPADGFARMRSKQRPCRGAPNVIRVPPTHMLTHPSLLLASASAIARTHRNIAIANAAGPTGLAALCFLRDAKREDKSRADLNVLHCPA